MRCPIYIGDEVTGAGYRLAGAQLRSPARGEAAMVLEAARAATSLVLVSAAVAVDIDPAQLRAALSALQPLVVIVPDAQEVVARPDVAARLREQLGIDT